MFDVFERISSQGKIVFLCRWRIRRKKMQPTIPFSAGFFFPLFFLPKKKNEINLKIELVTREYEILRQKREREKGKKHVVELDVCVCVVFLFVDVWIHLSFFLHWLDWIRCCCCYLWYLQPYHLLFLSQISLANQRIGCFPRETSIFYRIARYF